jgi:hypothetical protein
MGSLCNSSMDVRKRLWPCELCERGGVLRPVSWELLQGRLPEGLQGEKVVEGAGQVGGRDQGQTCQTWGEHTLVSP